MIVNSKVSLIKYILVSSVVVIIVIIGWINYRSLDDKIQRQTAFLHESTASFIPNDTQSIQGDKWLRVDDDSPERVDGTFKKGSHVKLFLPYLPYVAITHSINGTLCRPSNNEKGWEYYLASSHTHVDNRVFEFKLKKGIHFQDGTPFNADSVVMNMRFFKEKPFTYTKLCEIFDRVDRVDDYTVRFILTEPNGVFLHDLIQLPFYTKKYLDKFGWNGKSVCANLAEPGPYGLGPYILTEGYLEGDRNTPIVVLKADPNYWGENKPKVETITIHTALNIEEAAGLALMREGEIDITPIPFSFEVETVMSQYAKIITSPSTNHYAVHFNLVNGSKAILNDQIRYAINRSIDKEMLLNLSMMGEGVITPTMVSPHFYKVKKALKINEPFFEKQESIFEYNDKNTYLKKIVMDFQRENGMDTKIPLEINMITQESFLFIARDIKFFLSKININLTLDVVQDEKATFEQLFSTHKNQNSKKWDILIWANFDWFRHPWTAFFVYRPDDAWSSLPKNTTLTKYCDQLLTVSEESPKYIPLISDLIKYVYQNDYMLFLPSPNAIYAVNKEVVFHPRMSTIVPLWELEVTDLHWSLRGSKAYPENLKRPFNITRENIKTEKDNGH